MVPYIKIQHQNTKICVLARGMWKCCSEIEALIQQPKACVKQNKSMPLCFLVLTWVNVAETPSLVKPPTVHCNQPGSKLKSELQRYWESRRAKFCVQVCSKRVSEPARWVSWHTLKSYTTTI